MNRGREIAELIELIEQLDIEAADIQQEREVATEQLRIAREQEERARAAQARADRNANRRVPRAVAPDIQAGDRVIITSKVVLPAGIAGTRPVNKNDRKGVVTRVSLTGSRRIHIITDSGNTTWRLRRHLIKE